VADFETRLLTQLRRHGAEVDYLAMWVPDQDPVKSVLNMVEAAAAFGREEIAVRFGAGTLTPSQIDALVAQVGDLGAVEVAADSGNTLIVVSQIAS
jgi:hypothetical protein